MTDKEILAAVRRLHDISTECQKCYAQRAAIEQNVSDLVKERDGLLQILTWKSA